MTSRELVPSVSNSNQIELETIHSIQVTTFSRLMSSQPLQLNSWEMDFTSTTFKDADLKKTKDQTTSREIHSKLTISKAPKQELSIKWERVPLTITHMTTGMLQTLPSNPVDTATPWCQPTRCVTTKTNWCKSDKWKVAPQWCFRPHTMKRISPLL